jgi:DNA anti-recombination protein RmuC
MTVVTFDTYAVVKELMSVGFTDMQAEVVTRIVRQSQDVDLSALATKTDLQVGLAALRNELQVGLAALRNELQVGLAVAKSNLAETKSGLEKSLAETRAGLEKSLAETKADILKWMLGAIGMQTVVILGAVLTLARLGPR